MMDLLTDDSPSERPVDATRAGAVGSSASERVFGPAGWDFLAHVRGGEPLEVVIRTPAAVAAVIENYTPYKIPVGVWSRIRPGALTVLHRLELRSSTTARNDIGIVAYYAAGLYRDALWNPAVRATPPFTPDLVDHHVRVHLAGHSVKSQGRIRSRLRKMGLKLQPDVWLPGPDPYGEIAAAAPHTVEEQNLLLAHARAFWTVRHDPKFVLMLAVGFGAGLDASDCRQTYGTSVHVVEGVPVVDFGPPRPRRVVLRARWADIALDAAAAMGDQLVSGGYDSARTNIYSKQADRFNRGSAVRLRASRVRNTWLLDLLNDGVHINVVRDAAGVKELHTVERLLDHMSERPADEVIRQLRGAP